MSNPTPKPKILLRSELGKLSDRTLSVRIPQSYMDAWDRMDRNTRNAWLRAVIVEALQQKKDS